MKKLMKKITLLLAMVVAFSCVSGNVALAKTSQAQKAKKAYANRLARAAAGEDIFDVQGTGKEIQFATKNLNNDSIPELIISCRTYSDVYTYVNGKLRWIAGGDAESLIFYPSKGVIYSENIRRGFFGNYYYKFDGKRGKQVASKEGAYGGKSFTYKVNGKKVSAKKYNSYVKQLKGKAKKIKESNLKLVENTSKNRLKKLGYKK